MISNNLKNKLAVASVFLMTGATAFAQTATDTFDASSYAAKITGTIAGVLVIGGAVFALNVAIKSTKWARRAL